MKKLDKLILKAFFGPFIITTSVVVFIFLMRFILTYFDEFVGKDLGLIVFVKLFFYFSLITVPLSLPLAVLMASLMSYGNLGEFTELTAIKAAGISISRALRPTFIVAILISIGSFAFNNLVSPWANLKGWSLLWDVKTTKATLNIKEGIFYYDLPGYAIKVNKKFKDNKTLKEMVIYDHTESQGNRRVILADSAQMYTTLNNRYLVFELFNGHEYSDYTDRNSSNPNQTQFTRSAFKKSKLVFSLAAFDMHRTDEDQFKHHQSMKTVIELGKFIDSVKVDYKKLKQNYYPSAKSYYLYHLRDTKDTAHKKALPGRWLDELIGRPITDFGIRKNITEYALSQAKNLLATAETNQVYLKSRADDLRKNDLEWHHKFTFAFACFVMFLIGAPLGAIIKKGGFGMPVIIAILFYILMYVLMINGDKWAKEGLTSVVFGAWFANVILLSFGLYFLRQAQNDSRLFDADVYSIYFNRLKEKYIPMIQGIIQKKSQQNA
ncbi:MAG: LptF/LptG family permease [Spirosomataceae bacterium]